jgi:carbamoyl-phosphate synthase small subunit
MIEGKLIFKDGTEVLGESFGKKAAVAGEVVFATGMVGYPESLTDPSYRGQILVLTYPLVGNYGVPDRKTWESGRIQVTGLIVSSYIDTPSHHTSQRTLGAWLRQEGIPALAIRDTRFLAKKIRRQGTDLGKIIFGKEEIAFSDPNQRNLVAEVSTRRIKKAGKGKFALILVDCGAKKNIERCLIARGFKVISVPWDYDFLQKKLKFDAAVISNGPGNPKMADKTTEIMRRVLAKKTIPVFGICLGNQILALASGGDTYKLKFGHRGQNQPCYLVGTRRLFLTTQNHGYAVSRIPKGFKPWFTNANDQTNEGIIHQRLPIMSVQFHPEAHPGPTDTEWIFDYFLKRVRGRKS